MTDSQKLDLILLKLDEHDAKFELINTQLAELKADMVEVKADIVELKADVAELKADMVEVKADIVELKADVAELKADMVEVKADIVELKTKVNNINFILENEVRVNIIRIAEGHLDLSRNLHEAMKPNNEVEMLAVKVSMLETDVKELKRKIS
ncbi:MAG: hypothetical protein IJ324_02420 [Lachnospiraceae bacterium]|nr:hypothetical protein [Lachnospiraceae bacterium]